jgi:hypothetical protein
MDNKKDKLMSYVLLLRQWRNGSSSFSSKGRSLPGFLDHLRALRIA